MQGLWRRNSFGWNKDSRRKRVSKKNFIKDKKSLYNKLSKKRKDLSNQELFMLKEMDNKDFFYGSKTHPKIAYIMFGGQFRKKPYKKVHHKKGRAKLKHNLDKVNTSYKNTSPLIEISLSGTYGMDDYFNVDDNILDLDFDTNKSIELELD